MKKQSNEYQWHFVQNGGLIQVKISNIDDVLNLDKLDPKLWTALACPVSGLEFSEETLNLIDTDKNGRVRIPEILQTVDYIKKYFAKPEIIMESAENLPLDSLSETQFSFGNSPKEAATAVLKILGKENQREITLADVTANETLFSSSVINGDGIVPAECISEENVASVAKDIIATTGGADDISGVKGFTRANADTFFKEIRSVKEWRDAASQNDPKLFFLKEATDAAATAYLKVRDKINDYFLRCSLISFDGSAEQILKTQTDSIYTNENGGLSDKSKLAELPISLCQAGKPLILDHTINPAWAEAVHEFKSNVLFPIFSKEVTSITESAWKKIEELFAPYVQWVSQMSSNCFSELGLDKITDILNSDAEKVIYDYLEKEEKYPPIALATVELKKMILLRRDFVKLLHNFVNFEDFYKIDSEAIFQCGTLYIDGRSCDLCFKVLDIAKHGTMASLSQCYLVYCDCTKRGNSSEKMQIAALVSSGDTDNIITGRNGVFYDRKGNDWDATIVKIVENPISIKQAFWSPYKRLLKMIQEKIAKSTTAAENDVLNKMTKAVENPKDSAMNATANLQAKKGTDVGTVAAISVAFTGIATVVGGLLEAFFGLGMWIPLGIIGIILVISLPSMLIAWRKLRQRNIAPILDASGWAVNGNVKITPRLGSELTHLPTRPASGFLNKKDPFAIKKAPVKRIIFCLILVALIVCAVVMIIRNPDGLTGIWRNFMGLIRKFKI